MSVSITDSQALNIIKNLVADLENSVYASIKQIVIHMDVKAKSSEVKAIYDQALDKLKARIDLPYKMMEIFSNKVSFVTSGSSVNVMSISLMIAGLFSVLGLWRMSKRNYLL